MVAPVVAGQNSGWGTTAFAVNVPAGTVNGDLLLAFSASDWSTLALNSLPAGFTALTTLQYDGGSNAMHLAAGYRIANNEPASYTFPVGGSSDTAAAILRITGADATPVIAQVATAAVTAGTNTASAPAITPNGTDDLLICLVFTDGANGGGLITWTPPTGMTEVVDQQSETWTSLSIASLANPTSPSGGKIFTSSTNHNGGRAGSLSIKAAGAGGSNGSVTATVMGASTQAAAPQIAADSDVNAVVMTATSQELSPQVSSAGSTNIAPVPATATATMRSPSIASSNSVNIAAAPGQASSTAIAPSVVGENALVVATVAQASASVNIPVIVPTPSGFVVTYAIVGGVKTSIASVSRIVGGAKVPITAAYYAIIKGQKVQ